jgi:hypothetical protein
LTTGWLMGVHPVEYLLSLLERCCSRHRTVSSAATQIAIHAAADA